VEPRPLALEQAGDRDARGAPGAQGRRARRTIPQELTSRWIADADRIRALLGR
jgi:hypothetical protein